MLQWHSFGLDDTSSCTHSLVGAYRKTQAASSSKSATQGWRRPGAWYSMYSSVAATVQGSQKALSDGKDEELGDDGSESELSRGND